MFDPRLRDKTGKKEFPQRMERLNSESSSGDRWSLDKMLLANVLNDKENILYGIMYLR